MFNLDLTCSNARSSATFLTSFFFTGVGAFCVELQHLQIQGCHFLKSVLNLDLTRSNARASGTFFDQLFVFMAVRAFCAELQHLQIQGCHFLKSALNLVLILPDDRKCPGLLISCRIIDL